MVLCHSSRNHYRTGGDFHHDYRNTFAFLRDLGGDCAGAISLCPDGMTSGIGEDALRELTEDEADEVLRSLPERPLLQGLVEGYRISVAGASSESLRCFRPRRRRRRKSCPIQDTQAGSTAESPTKSPAASISCHRHENRRVGQPCKRQLQNLLGPWLAPALAKW